MGFVLNVYANSKHQEIYLPSMNNSDFVLMLRAKELDLEQDVQLLMEVINDEWFIKQSINYKVYCKGHIFDGEKLQQGQILELYLRKNKKLAVMVWQLPDNLTAYKKYSVVNTQEISIGQSTMNDISYQAQQIVSKHHAVIKWRNGKAFVVDTSKNGTFLKNQRIESNQECELHFGDLINMYGLSIVFLGKILAVHCAVGDVCVNISHLHQLDYIELGEKTRASKMIHDINSVVHISPRVLPDFYSGTENIESPPAKREGDKKPVWMTILPSFTMVLPMVIGYLLMSSGMVMGIFISLGSAIIGTFWAIANLRYAKKEEREQELKRRKRYEEYLVRCADEIRYKFQHNRQKLLDLYPDAVTCSRYNMYSQEIWTRQTSQSDFLSIRLGLGDLPFQVKITVPKIGFTMIDDELSEGPGKIAKSYEKMRDVPVNVQLNEHSVIGVLGNNNEETQMRILRLLAVQIAANHSYTHVKIAALYDGKGNNAEQWESLRWLPHIWNEDKSMRYIAASESEMGDVIYRLAQILRTRYETLSASYSSNKQKFSPHYILFVEKPEMLNSQVISKYLYEKGQELGITTVIFAEKYEDLPSTCDFVVENGDNFKGVYTVRENDNIRQEINFDSISLNDMEKMARCMSGLYVENVEYSSDIPSALTFFEMMNIHYLNELNVLERWQKNRTYETMRAVVGQKAGGVDCYLDINEKYHGPHGLVAGTTGSGKSETLQTYILSLAINYSPQDVGFFIIDFKGGGMANLFSNLPHMMGQISNLSGNQVHRAMVSIKSENNRRQRIFNEYNVNHIDAYTKLVKNREATVPIPHLLIVIDEFAELKREQPEFMRELISVAQVGRSLGVHLILATQKPSGTVDDNIWSNTKFKLCLRVADKQDSNDMLHKPDAAYLTQAGRCYLQVGNDEIYELFQSGWSGAIYDAKGDLSKKNVVLLDLQGRKAVVGGKLKDDRKERAEQEWIEKIVACLKYLMNQKSLSLTAVQNNVIEAKNMAKNCAAYLNTAGESYSESAVGLQRIEEMIYQWPEDTENITDIAAAIIRNFRKQGKKLPEQKEKTQLEAVVQYLAEMAHKTGFENKQQLWLPVLPEKIYLKNLHGYTDSTFKNGKWPVHSENFQLAAYIGMVDAPENQMQFPLMIDLARNGHLAVVGSITSGKSTFMQTLFYSLISSYSPAEVNLYGIDFSSQMMCPFEEDAHVGGIVQEGQDDRLRKLFGLLGSILKERKRLIKGGSFSQYIQYHGYTMPAIVVGIDGYANFREKTEDCFESNLTELIRDGEGYGIYMVISCGGYGASELQMKLSDKMKQGICLELGDKYAYSDILHISGLDVIPETNVKGRGLVSLEGSVLEYQTALSCEAANDYDRSEKLKQSCMEMSSCWKGKRAVCIPEIPEKPTWEQFSKLDDYQEKVKTGDYLPVAYKQEDASLYCVDLKQTYCYLILGKGKTGKSMFMRNVACAARDAGGRVILVDREDMPEQKTAELTGAEYLTTFDDIFNLTRDLILLTNERKPSREVLIQQGMEDDEIHNGMKKYQPVYIFIADLPDFLKRIYASHEGRGGINAPIEKILERGQQLNIYFIAVMDSGQAISVMDKIAYQNFIRVPNGILLGGELNKQTIFSYQNIPYGEQSKLMKPGMGYAVRQEDVQNVDLIVIPKNKGVTRT